MNKDYFDSSNLYVFLYRYKKPIIVIILISSILSIIASAFITDKFLSNAVIYPANTSSVRSLLSDQGNQESFTDFGEEEKSEQLLEILKSDKVRSKILTRFNLMDHYKINETSTNTPNHDLNEIYDDNISFKKNKNMAVEISVLDHNNDTAALIAKELLTVLDEVVNDIRKVRAVQGYQVVKTKYDMLASEIQVMEDSLNKIMRKGIINIPAQSEVYSNSYAEAIRLGNSSAAAKLKEELNLLSQDGVQFISLTEKLENERLKLSSLKGKYEEAKADAEESIQNFFVVTSPSVAEKKTYPIRWLIVSVSVIGSLFLGIIFVIFFEQFQIIRAKLHDK